MPPLKAKSKCADHLKHSFHPLIQDCILINIVLSQQMSAWWRLETCPRNWQKPWCQETENVNLFTTLICSEKNPNGSCYECRMPSKPRNVKLVSSLGAIFTLFAGTCNNAVATKWISRESLHSPSLGYQPQHMDHWLTWLPASINCVSVSTSPIKSNIFWLPQIRQNHHLPPTKLLELPVNCRI